VYQWPQQRTYAYDSLGNLTSAKVPETNQVATTFTYTNFGEVYQRTDPRGVVTTYGYDSLNRLYTIGYSDGTPGATYTYGSSPAAFNNGAITSFTDGSGSTTFTYNNLEQITKAAKVLGGVTYNIQYSYNAAGELQTLTYPSGRVVTQTYDPIGRLQKIADATNSYMTLTPTTDYNSAGQLKHFSYGKGVVADFAYNDHFETTSIRYSKSGSADLLNLAYNYGTQNDGKIATITDNLDATLPNRRVLQRRQLWRFEEYRKGRGRCEKSKRKERSRTKGMVRPRVGKVPGGTLGSRKGTRLV
jgi:YD repeat-containing protein